MGPGATFGWQHDARWRPGGEISLFDNEADPPLAKQSRALVLRVDTKTRRVELVHAYTHPAGLLSGSQGDIQFLPGGHVFVGWGSNPYFTEFDQKGRVIFGGRFTKGADSYRAYRFVWTGRPHDPPDLTVRTNWLGRVTAYASWNGATEVTRWQVLAGPDAHHLQEVATVARSGFETRIDLRRLREYSVAVRALDAAGRSLGESPVQEPTR